MSKLIKNGPQIVHQHVTTQTKEGEVTINLNLTITINQDGNVAISANNTQTQKEGIPDSIFVVPEFETTTELLNFGQDAGGR